MCDSCNKACQDCGPDCLPERGYKGLGVVDSPNKTAGEQSISIWPTLSTLSEVISMTEDLVSLAKDKGSVLSDSPEIPSIGKVDLVIRQIKEQIARIRRINNQLLPLKD